MNLHASFALTGSSVVDLNVGPCCLRWRRSKHRFSDLVYGEPVNLCFHQIGKVCLWLADLRKDGGCSNRKRVIDRRYGENPAGYVFYADSVFYDLCFKLLFAGCVFYDQGIRSAHAYAQEHWAKLCQCRNGDVRNEMIVTESRESDDALYRTFRNTFPRLALEVGSLKWEQLHNTPALALWRSVLVAQEVDICSHVVVFAKCLLLKPTTGTHAYIG